MQIEAAVQEERNRILKEIDQIDINSPSQLNALGMKMLIVDIIKKDYASFNIIKETNLGLEEVENPDHCLCLDCTVTRDGL